MLVKQVGIYLLSNGLSAQRLAAPRRFLLARRSTIQTTHPLQLRPQPLHIERTLLIGPAALHPKQEEVRGPRVGVGYRPAVAQVDPAKDHGIAGLHRHRSRGLLAFAALPQLAQLETPPAPAPAAADPAAQNPAVVDAARRFLVLIDQGRWNESYQATGASFRTSNTLKVWSTVSEQVRAPLGAVQSRTLISQENLPAPPNGLQLVKYRTRFAGGERVETVTLDKVDGVWLVVGVMIG